MRLTVSIKVADRKTFGYFEKTDSIKQYYWVPWEPLLKLPNIAHHFHQMLRTRKELTETYGIYKIVTFFRIIIVHIKVNGTLYVWVLSLNFSAQNMPRLRAHSIYQESRQPTRLNDTRFLTATQKGESVPSYQWFHPIECIYFSFSFKKAFTVVIIITVSE